MVAIDEKSPAIIRAMATTILDDDIDLDDCVAVCTRLMQAGWPAPMVEWYYASVITMVAIRRENANRKINT